MRALILCIALALPAAAQSTYHVSTSGNDSNSGDASSPWASLTKASAVAVAGDIVVVEDGTYYIPQGGKVNGTQAGDWEIGSNGSAGKPVTYIAQDKWKAKLVGQGKGSATAVVGMHGSYNTLENFDITGTDSAGVILAVTYTASHNDAKGNYVHDIVVPCDNNGGCALNTGGGSNYAGVSDDSFFDNFVVNVTNSGGASCSYHTTCGIYEAVPDGIVANNTVINAGYGIQMWHAATHETIFGNTVLDSVSGIVVGGGDSGTTTGNDYTLVQNNITYNNSVVGITLSGTVGTHNQFIANQGYKNKLDFQAGLDCSGCFHANPRFVRNNGSITGNYCPSKNSPARGKGQAMAGIRTDIHGSPRPQAGPTVVGACVGSGKNF